MGELRPDEEWARQIVAATLGVAVTQYDDGSEESMYDLDVRYPDGRRAAVEVTAAADGETIAFWNLANGDGRWIEPSLSGGWAVICSPSARVKRIRKELPLLLHQLEMLGIEQLRVRRSSQGSPLEQIASGLGVVWAFQSDTDYPGSIYPSVDLPTARTTGFVAVTGDALARWVGGFLCEEARLDVRRKLGAADVEERHAFVILPGFATAHFGVVDLLMRAGAPLPTVDPELPAEVTHVWTVSTWSTGTGMRWSPAGGWERFDKLSSRTRSSPERPRASSGE